MVPHVLTMLMDTAATVLMDPMKLTVKQVIISLFIYQ